MISLQLLSRCLSKAAETKGKAKVISNPAAGSATPSTTTSTPKGLKPKSKICIDLLVVATDG